jgi:hypothetical protein
MGVGKGGWGGGSGGGGGNGRGDEWVVCLVCVSCDDDEPPANHNQARDHSFTLTMASKC